MIFGVSQNKLSFGANPKGQCSCAQPWPFVFSLQMSCPTTSCPLDSQEGRLMDPAVVEDIPRTEQLTPAHAQQFVESTPNQHVASRRGRPRFRICKPIPTTPVTRPSPIIHDAVETPRPDTTSVIENAVNGSVRRRLSFAVARTPKRACTDRPAFRICGNKERTQPESARARVEGPLLASLSSSCAAAASACAAFRSLVSGAMFNPSLLRDSLILDVVNQVEGLYIVQPVDVSSGASIFALLAPCSLRSDDRLVEQLPGQTKRNDASSIIFVPQPWHISSTDCLGHLDIKWLIVPFRISIVEKDRVPALPPAIALNKTLFELTKNVDQGGECNDDRLTENQMGEILGAVSPNIYLRLSDISPHFTVVSIKLQVIFSIPPAQMAIVQDDVSEIAILLLREHSSIPNVGYQTFVNLTILPVRLSAQSVLQLVLANYDSNNLNMTVHNVLKSVKTCLTLSVDPL